MERGIRIIMRKEKSIVIKREREREREMHRRHFTINVLCEETNKIG